METGTTVGWRLALVGVVVLLLAAGFIGTSCPPPPAPVTADSLAAARAGFAADTARAWGEARRQALRADSAIQVSRTAKAEADRLRRVRKEKPPTISYGTDSVPMVPKADYDSLAAEADSLWSAVVSDSVAIKAQNERIAADSSAYAALASLRDRENAIHTSAITTLQRDRARARRSGCFLGLPKPIIGPGYGLALVNGQAGHGPTFTVTMPLGGCRR